MKINRDLIYELPSKMISDFPNILIYKGDIVKCRYQIEKNFRNQYELFIDDEYVLLSELEFKVVTIEDFIIEKGRVLNSEDFVHKNIVII